MESNQKILNEIDSCINVYNTIFSKNKKVNYLSHFVTKGERYYQALEKYSVKNLEELNKINIQIIKVIRKNNLLEGENMKKELDKLNIGYVIEPGKFFAKGWSQIHYAEFWKKVVEKYADKVIFHDLFYTSEGGLEEFIISIENNKEIRLFNNLKKFNSKNILSKIEDTIIRVDKIGEDIERFKDIYLRLKKII